jgi:hypothetical protein
MILPPFILTPKKAPSDPNRFLMRFSRLIGYAVIFGTMPNSLHIKR